MQIKKLDILSFMDAYKISLENANCSLSSEIVGLENLLGRVLAEDLRVSKNVPSFNNSALDGFAFKSGDVDKRLKIATTIFAGDEPKEVLGFGECYKIMTGAKVPNDADTVVAIEKCIEVSEEYVKVPKNVKKGDALRLKGEELNVGEILFKKGEVIDFSHIALLSAQGKSAVKVYKKLSISVVSTGNELKEPWEKANEDEIYNANSFAIIALLKKHNFYPNYIGVIPDDLEKSIEFISKLKSYDVVITTGGISMGEADFLEEAFKKNNIKSFFHGVNVKPGRPTMMGKMEKTFVMAMPGNPLTTLLNVFLLSLPILLKLQGARKYFYDFVKAENKKEFKTRLKRSDIVLGALRNGEFSVTRDNKVGSGMLTPLWESNCVAVIGEDIDIVKKEKILNIIPFNSVMSEYFNNFNN